MPLCDGFFEPAPGQIVVLRHAFPPAIHTAEAVLRVGISYFGELYQSAQACFIPLRGGFCITLTGHAVVPRHAFAVGVLLAEPMPVFRVVPRGSSSGLFVFRSRLLAAVDGCFAALLRQLLLEEGIGVLFLLQFLFQAFYFFCRAA